jgi:hypothetical protein
MSSQKTPQTNEKLYCAVKDKTVIVYTKTEPLTDEQLEEMMIESVPYGYVESFI